MRHTYGARRASPAVDDVSLQVGSGEVVGLVGESGSGKSTIGRAIAGLLKPAGGTLVWEAEQLPWRVTKRPSERRRNIQIIFQNANSALNPRHTVGMLLHRSVSLFRADLKSAASRRQAIADALEEVRLSPELASRYPYQLSGGQKQRIAIARAFIARPSLVICDEIVSSQDVSVQAALLELLRAMRNAHGTSLLFISHDLGVVRSIASYTYILELGRVVEHGPTGVLFEQPSHPYTTRLLQAAQATETQIEPRPTQP